MLECSTSETPMSAAVVERFKPARGGLRDLPHGLPRLQPPGWICQNIQPTLFMENVAAQTLGKEVELSCDESTSDCMQMLLINTRDPSVLERFMASFLDHLQLVCTHHAGAYVMQTLLEAALRFLQHPSDVSRSSFV
ncbi:hypothetical protein HPB48_001270 [Haemaphysalis longicornis]|uniref:Uncharacterized protein n=1 Tax=Haemaphysalis longicornis TaxID=44386 RepID=A0A9J6FJU3_HAELO|nr:hypothetical protein HPB48_001270 [Haemaphysalis longicornis]